MVGEEDELVGFSAGPVVRVGAVFPTVTAVVIDAAFASKKFAKRKNNPRIKT